MQRTTVFLSRRISPGQIAFTDISDPGADVALVASPPSIIDFFPSLLYFLAPFAPTSSLPEILQVLPSILLVVPGECEITRRVRTSQGFALRRKQTLLLEIVMVLYVINTTRL